MGTKGGKGSCESVGSGSSFEELDMEVEVEEEKEEKKNEAEKEDHNGQQKPMMVGETIGNREEWRIKRIRGSVGEWWVHMWVWVHVRKGESLSVSLKSSKAFFSSYVFEINIPKYPKSYFFVISKQAVIPFRTFY